MARGNRAGDSGARAAGRAREHEFGECWRIALPVDELWPGGEELVRRRCAALAAAKPASGGEGEATASCESPWWDGISDEARVARSGDLRAGRQRGVSGRRAAEVDGRLTVELLARSRLFGRVGRARGVVAAACRARRRSSRSTARALTGRWWSTARVGIC